MLASAYPYSRQPSHIHVQRAHNSNNTHTRTYTNCYRCGVGAAAHGMAICQECYEFVHGRRTADPAAFPYDGDLIPVMRRIESMRAMRLPDCMVRLALAADPRYRHAVRQRQNAVGRPV